MQNKIEQELIKNHNQLKYLKLNRLNNEYVATFNDSSNYTIAKGYGASIIEAINDLHSALV